MIQTKENQKTPHSHEESTQPDASRPRSVVSSSRGTYEGFRHVYRYLPAIALFIILILIAEMLVAYGVVSEFVLPRPSNIGRTFIDGFASGVYAVQGLNTMLAVVVGFLLALVLAVGLAGLMTASAFVDRLLMPYIVGLQSMPKVALAPLIILYLGFGNNAKITIVALMAFFPMVVNSLEGMKIRDRVHYELMITLGASRWQQFRYLRLPGALPSIFAGMRVGLILALLGAVTAEIVGSRNGLGYVMLQDKAAFNVAGVFAILLVMLIIGQMLNAIMTWLERKVTASWAGDISRAEN